MKNGQPYLCIYNLQTHNSQLPQLALQNIVTIIAGMNKQELELNLPKSSAPRVVIIGGGFGGLTLAKKLRGQEFQVVLLDKNNYHQFQPLFYQVAMSGLEPSSISFPFRKVFRSAPNVYFRVAEVTEVQPDRNCIQTTLGRLTYDYLIIAIGTKTNYFGNSNFEKNTHSLKSISDSLYLRNTLLSDFEEALITGDFKTRQQFLDIVIVGGGPTGVELAGALAEMKSYILPKDYTELDSKEVDIYLVQAGPHLLPGMSQKASRDAMRFLTRMGVIVKTNARVKDYNGREVIFQNGETIGCTKVIWAAGVTGNLLSGVPDPAKCRRNRIKVNSYNQVEGCENVFAIGDIALMVEDQAYPDGHPQVAQPAMQQAKLLARNLKALNQQKPLRHFRYKDKGSMATIGRNKAVVDLGKISFSGFWAWVAWLFVHIYNLIGVKNKLFVVINWIWNYITYDQSLRLIIKPKSTLEDQDSQKTKIRRQKSDM